ncbi:MAG: cache domain-containing protein [Terriglobales bacterium]
MPFDTAEFRISLQKLFLVLVVILIPIMLFGLYVGLQANRQVQHMSGAYFRTITRASAVITSEYLSERVAEVVTLANQPSVQQSVMNANRAYGNAVDSAMQVRAEQMEKKWKTSESDALVKTMFSSEAGSAIRRQRDLNPKLLRITVVDEAGATVTATDKPLNYFQTGSEYWRAFAKNAHPSVYVSELRYDDQSRTQYISVSAPIFQEGTGRFIGAVTALVDMSPLFAYLDQQQIAQTGRVFLVKDDGTVVTLPGVAPQGKVRSEEYNAIRDALGTLHGREAGYMYATLPNGVNYLIGFADPGLKPAYENLGWLVIASQETREATGPVRNMAYFALFLLVVGLILLSVLGAYVFEHRKQEMEDIKEKEEGPKKMVAAQ